MKREPREIAVVAEVALFLLAATLAVAPVAAQQVTGELGSPSATVTIKGDRLLAPPLPFGGVIKESATDSNPWWPPRVESGINSSNAPNILGTSYTISAEVDVPQGGGDGMLVTMGGRWGGYGLYPAQRQAGVRLQHAHQVPFPFNGTINKVTFNLGPMQLAEEDKGEGSEGNRHSQRLG